MQLVLISVLLMSGATLLFLGANGFPALPPILAGGPLERLPTRARRHASTPRGTAEPRPQESGLPPVPFQDSDALLAELMTEMIAFNERLADLRRQVTELKNPRLPQDEVRTEPAPPKKPRRRATRAQA